MEQLHESEALQVLVLKQSQVARAAPGLLHLVSLGCQKADGDGVCPEIGEAEWGKAKLSLGLHSLQW